MKCFSLNKYLNHFLSLKIFLSLFSSFILMNEGKAQVSEMAFGYRRTLNQDWMGFNGQNMIRDSLGWTNPYLKNNLPELHPRNIRYPGGGLANWWDWKKGWF